MARKNSSQRRRLRAHKARVQAHEIDAGKLQQGATTSALGNFTQFKYSRAYDHRTQEYLGHPVTVRSRNGGKKLAKGAVKIYTGDRPKTV